MSHKYQNLGAFLHSLPTHNPELAPLLLYVNRQGVYEKYKNIKSSASFLIPSKQMMDQLDKLYKSKQFAKLDSLVLSLLINSKLSTPTDWKNGIHVASGCTLLPSKLDKKSVHLGNVSAKLSNKFTGAIQFWELSGESIPEGKFLKKSQIKVVKGTFENKNQDTGNYKKLLEICREKIIKEGGVKELICDLFYTLDDEQKQIALCFINNNPFAEFFLLIDSPFIKVDADAFIQNSTNACYEDILKTKGEYLCSRGIEHEFQELKETIEDTNFMENNYEKFYRAVAENDGKFEYDGKTFDVCHPAIAKHLYTIEMFCFCMKKHEEKFNKSADKESIVKEMTEINELTNTHSTQNAIFEESDNPIVKFEEFEARFKAFGLCLCKIIKEGGEKENKSIKLKDRKLLKLKRKIAKLSESQKKKLLD